MGFESILEQVLTCSCCREPGISWDIMPGAAVSAACGLPSPRTDLETDVGASPHAKTPGTKRRAAVVTCDSWHRCSRSHRDSDASTSWGHISAPSRPLVLVLGFPSFRCSLTFRSRYWLLSSSSMVGYSGDTAQFHQNFFL